MRINHNISALNAWRALGQTDNAMTKSLEKLSSGLRINRAADDAAGLAISEKMRGQIRGLNQAIRNAQDAISLIQTAEGALNETHSILQRMRELAVQAATDTNTDKDREAIQEEITQLVAELDRIADTTEFNTQKLLNGDFKGKIFHIGANISQNITLDIAEMDAASLLLNVDSVDTGGTGPVAASAKFGDVSNYITFTAKEAGTAGNDITIVFKKAEAESGLSVSVDNDEKTITITLAIDSSSGEITSRLSDIFSALENNTEAKNLVSVELVGNGETLASITNDTETIQLSGGSDGDSGATNGTIIDVSNQADANDAIDIIQTALDKVSTERSKLGALQNRLEHTINNLSVAAENLTAAESRIRDVDMAKEMMEFTKNQILIQAGTAMLANANVRPQSVLQLLG
jgi:flagellin